MIYLRQSLLRIELDTEISLATASELKILYKKPSGATDEWPATASGTIMYYDTVEGDLSESGVWKLQGKVVIGGRTGYTTTVDMVVNKPYQ